MSEEAANATKAVVRPIMYHEYESADTDLILTAFWYSHVHWVLLVLRVHYRHRARCMYQSRSKLSDWIEVWPANGPGKLFLLPSVSIRAS